MSVRTFKPIKLVRKKNKGAKFDPVEIKSYLDLIIVVSIILGAIIGSLLFRQYLAGEGIAGASIGIWSNIVLFGEFSISFSFMICLILFGPAMTRSISGTQFPRKISELLLTGYAPSSLLLAYVFAKDFLEPWATPAFVFSIIALIVAIFERYNKYDLKIKPMFYVFANLYNLMWSLYAIYDLQFFYYEYRFSDARFLIGLAVALLISPIVALIEFRIKSASYLIAVFAIVMVIFTNGLSVSRGVARFLSIGQYKAKLILSPNNFDKEAASLPGTLVFNQKSGKIENTPPITLTNLTTPLLCISLSSPEYYFARIALDLDGDCSHGVSGKSTFDEIARTTHSPTFLIPREAVSLVDPESPGQRD